MAAVTLTFTTTLAQPPEKVWAHATSLEGINAEIAPLLRIATPPGVKDLATLKDFLATGRPLTAMLMGGGWLPLTWWEPRVELLEGMRFVERSSMPPFVLWRHERELKPAGAGTEVVDRITLAPRFPWPEPVVQGFVEQLFLHRHRRLKEMFG